MITTNKFITRFFSKVKLPIDGSTTCWEWNASRDKKGYGRIGISKNKTIFAHRASWMIANGEIPEGMHVCHSCDHPWCVNPYHLWIGTNGDNIRDAVKKKRHWHCAKTHCKKGHPFRGDNLKVVGNRRICLECKRDSARRVAINAWHRHMERRAAGDASAIEFDKERSRKQCIRHAKKQALAKMESDEEAKRVERNTKARVSRARRRAAA